MAKQTINQTQLKNNDGWQLCPQTATYVDTNAIKFTGTTIDGTISNGMKLKLTNNSTVKYYSITTVTTAQGSDRAFLISGPVPLVSGSITNLYFSTEDHPYGFPYEIPQQAWQAPTLLNNWVNYDTNTFAGAGYMKDSMGFVHIQGLVKSGTVNATVFNLPAGYRPLKAHSFVQNSNSAFGTMNVTGAGNVDIIAGSNVFFYLDCSFRAEQ